MDGARWALGRAGVIRRQRSSSVGGVGPGEKRAAVDRWRDRANESDLEGPVGRLDGLVIRMIPLPLWRVGGRSDGRWQQPVAMNDARPRSGAGRFSVMRMKRRKCRECADGGDGQAGHHASKMPGVKHEGASIRHA